MAVRGHCPICERAKRKSDHEITPTGMRRHPDRGTDKWWRVVMHSDGAGGVCEGSGQLV